MKEAGIYIHIPFCKRRCYYCDFVSFSGKNELVEKYINALNNEILETAKKLSKDYDITTIYIGGGTPSFINEKYIEKTLNNIFSNWNVCKEAEITLEVNPGTITEEKMKNYKRIGINRISIGLQSTNDKLLEGIGRIHNYNDFLTTYDIARKVKFDNINVDLMLGLPTQKIEDLQDSLDKVINLSPEHISVYSLIVEEGTVLQKMLEEGKIELPQEELERQMYWKVKQMLEQNGYIHYEISNFAKEGYNSRHNSNCWEQKEYVGFGVSAHSYIDNKRFCNTNIIEEYIKNIEECDMEKNKIICEVQTKEDKQKEYMLLGLRKIDGVKIEEFKDKFIDDPLILYHDELLKLVSENLLNVDSNYIKLTSKGLDLANLVWEEFV